MSTHDWINVAIIGVALVFTVLNVMQTRRFRRETRRSPRDGR